MLCVVVPLLLMTVRGCVVVWLGVGRDGASGETELAPIAGQGCGRGGGGLHRWVENDHGGGRKFTNKASTLVQLC